MAGQGGYRWVTCRRGNVPDNAVVGGQDSGETLYVGRAVRGDIIIPGKVHPSLKCCYVSYAGSEEWYTEYQVLVCDGAKLTWQKCRDGHVPSGAIQGGTSSTREPLYIGRAPHGDTLTCGRVHPSHGRLYLPYYNKEHGYSEYEVLTCNTDD